MITYWAVRSNRRPCLLHPFLSIYWIGTLKNPHTCLKMVGERRPWWYGPSQGLGDCYEPAVILDLYCCGDPAKLENLNKPINYI